MAADTDIEIKAKARHLRMSAKKIRAVLAPIRGMEAGKALDYLNFLNRKKAARLVAKLIESAIANAEHDFNLSKENLFIKKIVADHGPILKRFRPRAMGRAATIYRRTSHLSVVLSPKQGVKIKDEPLEKKQPSVVQKFEEEKPEEKTMELAKEKVKKVKAEKERTEPKKIFDAHRQGKHRSKAHLDTIRRRTKGGLLKRLFRRKAV